MTEVAVSFVPKTRARKQRRAEIASIVHRYPARIARQLALAHALQRRVNSGEFADYASMARELGFTRARVTQLMDLLLIAPDIQEEILFLDAPAGAQPVSERALRLALLSSLDWRDQRRSWATLRRSWARTDRSEAGHRA